MNQHTAHAPALAVQGTVASGANADSVIPFDVVVIRDKNLLKQIGQMDAATWFGPKGRCNYRGGPKAKVQFHSWEFVPGQLFRIGVPVPHGAKAVLGFANYATPGEHRISFVHSGSQLLEMNKDGVHVLTDAGVRNPAQPFAPEQQKVCPDD